MLYLFLSVFHEGDGVKIFKMMHTEDPRSLVYSSPAQFTVYTFDNYPSLQIRKGKLILLGQGFCDTSISERLASSREMSKGVLATKEGKDITSHIRTEALL